MRFIKLSLLYAALFVAASAGVADSKSKGNAAQAAAPAANQATVDLTVSGMS
jgi:hypothetical protein